jgi:hypothetical protein
MGTFPKVPSFSYLGSKLGSGLVFCLSQKSHTNKLKFQGKDESDKDISYLQDEILPCSPAIYKKSGSARNLTHKLAYIVFV